MTPRPAGPGARPRPARRALAALLAAAWVPAARPAVAQVGQGEGQGTAGDALDATMRALAAIRRSRARFEESKEVAGLGGTLNSVGTLSWDAPDRLERRTTEPFEEILTIAGDRLTYARPAQNVRREFALDAAPELRPFAEGLRAVLAGDLPTLRRYFDVSFDGAPAAWTLRLVPRSLVVRAAVQRITVTGAGAAIRLVETAGNESTTLRVTPLP